MTSQSTLIIFIDYGPMTPPADKAHQKVSFYFNVNFNSAYLSTQNWLHK